MTKKLFISLFLTFALLILSNVESSGQCPTCPSPHTLESVIVQISSTCEVTVNYCFQCLPNGHARAEMCSIDFSFHGTSNCFGTPIDFSFLDKVRKGMAIDAAKKCSDELNISIEPCSSENKTTIETFLPTCVYFGPVDPIGGFVSLFSCAQLPGQCIQEWLVCWEDPDYVAYPVGPPNKISGICTSSLIIFDPLNLPNYCFEICF